MKVVTYIVTNIVTTIVAKFILILNKKLKIEKVIFDSQEKAKIEKVMINLLELNCDFSEKCVILTNTLVLTKFVTFCGKNCGNFYILVPANSITILP